MSSYAFSGFLFRPIAFFLVPGTILLLLSLLELGWIGWHTLSHVGGLSGSLDHRFSVALTMTWQESAHSFVIGGVSLILAVQLISLGILASQNKRYFEEVFHLGTALYRTVGRSANVAASDVAQGNGVHQEVTREPKHREPA
jgi:hypothetical protein